MMTRMGRPGSFRGVVIFAIVGGRPTSFSQIARSIDVAD